MGTSMCTASRPQQGLAEGAKLLASISTAQGRARKDQLPPHGCSLRIFPTHMTDVTHRATGSGLQWAHCWCWEEEGNDRPGDVAWRWRGRWDLLLSPCCVSCLLLGCGFFSFWISRAQGAARPLGRPPAEAHSPCAFSGRRRAGRVRGGVSISLPLERTSGSTRINSLGAMAEAPPGPQFPFL